MFVVGCLDFQCFDEQCFFCLCLVSQVVEIGGSVLVMLNVVNEVVVVVFFEWYICFSDIVVIIEDVLNCEVVIVVELFDQVLVVDCCVCLVVG